jgi:hypothetical protein
MYRLRTPDTHKPLFISNQIIQDYSENRVDTLHLKNLLHLGEDRYLTTLVLKHFPSYKTKFVRDAFAQTIAPDSAKVLLSQRRRWINSTIHNLAELVFLDQLCGFCCFSMRFVVFIDLLSTVIAPVTVAYVCDLSPLLLCLYNTDVVDWLSTLPGYRYSCHHSDPVYRHACCYLRSTSSGLHLQDEMGYDRLDDLCVHHYRRHLASLTAQSTFSPSPCSPSSSPCTRSGRWTISVGVLRVLVSHSRFGNRTPKR